MKLAIRAYIGTLILLLLVLGVPAQQRSEKDDRNTAPTVGTGGPVGGPTGLFTVYDGQTLRKGEYTLSFALSNYDRDPGNVDITSVPVSFQVGVSNHLELFFSTEAYRGIKVNAPRNLSSFYLPNSQLNINGVLTSGPAIVLAPRGTGTSIYGNSAVFRPTGTAPFAVFPYIGSNLGTFGFQAPFSSGQFFGFCTFPTQCNATVGAPVTGGGTAAFPGLGSVYGSILPGVVWTTENLTDAAGRPRGTGPVSFSTAPTYVADAPFINRTWGQSSFNSLTFGGKWRFNSTKSAWGHGITAFYRWYLDTADDASGFNMMQRGAGPGSNWGDIGITYFVDGRLTKWANLSANVGYVYTSKTKGTFNGSEVTMFDPGDELQIAIGADFPVNRYFQPILEIRSLNYVGGRTPNALEQNPLDGLAGVRIFPRRWFGFSFAYRYNFNQQDRDFYDDDPMTSNVFLPCSPFVTGCAPATVTRTFQGVPPGVTASTDPHGYIAQFFIGRRDKRAGEIVNVPANVDSVTLGATVITLPCPAGQVSTSGACPDSSKVISVATRATDPENDVLTYNSTASGGRIVGTGANVQWDLSTAQVGTYTITTGVDDGCGVCGRTNTQTIRVQACPDCMTPKTCDCGSLSVSGPSGVTNPGDTMTFTANKTGSGDFTYNWSVSAGTIESGQGTPSIVVRTTSAMAGSNVTATVNVGGTDPTCNCQKEASDTAGVQARPEASLVDEFGKASNDDIKARVDNFYIQLNNNPTSQGYIINYGTAAEIKARRAAINKAIAFRKYDASRVTFIDGPNNGTGVNTKFYLVPSGATPPNP